MKHNLKPGDLVRINNQGLFFNEDPVAMAPYIGREYVIASIKAHGQVYFTTSEHIAPSMKPVNGWAWYANGVDLVEPKPGDIEDYEIVDSIQVSTKQLEDGDIVIYGRTIYKKIKKVAMTLEEIETKLGHKVKIKV